jgi:GTPase SAR1 family protein
MVADAGRRDVTMLRYYCCSVGYLKKKGEAPRPTNNIVATMQEQSESSKSETKLPVLERFALRKEGENISPVCVIVVGMAGSGKTTLMAQLQRSLQVPNKKEEEELQDSKLPAKKKDNDEQEMTASNKTGYCVNLDPATLLVPYGASIDIRDTVDYKQVMQQHKLGPNGAIMTSLNLYCTKFDQVMGILEKRADTMDYILVDTPGQIEAFTWSASGSIMSEALASSFPTVLAFVVDTARCASSPNTFMSNMLYACSMLYRTRLPLVIVFNKTDVVPHEFCLEWMRDYEAFQEALDQVASDAGYYGSLTRSLSLVLDEFYRDLHTCGVSAATGDGVDEFWQTITLAAQDFESDYLQDLKLRMEEQQVKKEAHARDSVRRLERDLDHDNDQT